MAYSKLELIESKNPEWNDCGMILYRAAGTWIPAYAGMTTR